MSDMLGTDLGAPEHERERAADRPAVPGDEPDGFDYEACEPGYDGESTDQVHVDETELRIENAELRVELEDARRELDELLVEKDNVREINFNLRQELQRVENETRGEDQRARRKPASQPDTDPIFTTLNDWVTRWMLPLFRRELDGRSTTFCVQWWRHPEAYYRLDALWKSWEFMRLKPGTGTAVWVKDYLDPHMGVLMSSNGPMAGCTLKKHSAHPIEPWPLQDIPDLRHMVRLYDRAGLQYADPKPAANGRRGLAAVQAVPWTGKDQQR